MIGRREAICLLSVRLEPDQPLEIAQVSDGAVESEPDDESDIDKHQPDEDIDN